MVPPGPIPNPEVKHQHVDGSRTTGPARVDSCQGKRSPQNESSAGFSVITVAGSAKVEVVLPTIFSGCFGPAPRALTPAERGQTAARFG